MIMTGIGTFYERIFKFFDRVAKVSQGSVPPPFLIS
jgi:hypothetical protein